MTGFENKALFVLRNWQSIGYTEDHSVGEEEIIDQQLRVYKRKARNYVLPPKVRIKSKNSLYTCLGKHSESFSLNNPQGRLLAKAPCFLYVAYMITNIGAYCKPPGGN